VDERSIRHGVDVLVGAIRDLEQRHPVPQVEDEAAIRSEQD